MQLHFFDGQIESFVGGIVTGNALEPELCGARMFAFHFRLYVDMGQDTMRKDICDFECRENILQSILDGRDRFGSA